jgi:drug/metabolite transporter (DMT)-like permease
MYIPYRKAYISGMNPLSFVTVFTVGELGTVLALGAACHSGPESFWAEVAKARPAMFWLFLGGFCWVLGDLFQQYAAKYIGISRGIPLSNTNQMWGLAWGALVFGELSGLSATSQWLVIGGSAIMILGALAISFAEAPPSERASWQRAVQRECRRYNMDEASVAAAVRGDHAGAGPKPKRHWWEALVFLGAIGIFIFLGNGATRQELTVNAPWMVLLLIASLALLVICGVALWRRTRFS